MDKYILNRNVVDRLVKEWKEHGKLIIAYDFDGTVYDYHNEGLDFTMVINLLRRCRNIGAYFIIFTSCEESKFKDIWKYCKEKDIPVDSINEDYEDIPFTGRKLYYNIMLDDRAGLGSAYLCLDEACNIMEGEIL